MSTTTTGLPANVEIYLAALRAQLADLAPGERDDLLSEVEPSLLEAAAEGDDPIADRLGPAADFAADLRASAGLPPAPRAAAARPGGVRAAFAQLADSQSVRRSLALLHELAPLWWAVRAYLAVGLLALLAGAEWSARYPALPHFGSGAGTALVLVLALAGSLALGLRTRRPRGSLRRPVIALNAVLLVAALPVLAHAADSPWLVQPYDEPVAAETPEGVSLDGVAVENIYPYDRRGRLLHDVRLYDSSGQPLSVLRGADDPDRRHVFERGGARALNAFPIRHFEPGTRRVARPGAGPDVDPAPLRTPALERPGRR